MDSLPTLLEFGVDVAWRAGRATLSYFQTGIEAETKADQSPVTLADREAERIVRERIEARFPDHGIVGEEFGVKRPDARRRWIVDPIDGTRSFIRGVPLYGVLLALEDQGDAVLGVIHLPALGETIYAARGEGCWWDGRRAAVSDVADLDSALVLTSDELLHPAVTAQRGTELTQSATVRPNIDPLPTPTAGRTDVVPLPPPGVGREGHGTTDHPLSYAAGWHRLRARAGLTRTWGDCYGYALVATGRAEAMLDPVLSIWDAAAIAPVIEEAGGVVTDWRGRAGYDHGTLVATNVALAREVRSLLVEDET